MKDTSSGLHRQPTMLGHSATRRRRGSRRTARRGAIAALGGILLVVLVIAAAFTIDIAFMKLAKSQLQAATDAAARAAGTTLGSAQDVDVARVAAIQTAARNQVAGSPLALSDDDVVFGRSDRSGNGTFTFTPGGSPLNGVRVTGRRTFSSTAGPVPLFLGNLLGREYFQPVAVAGVTRLDRDICVVVDRSGSMAWDLSDEQWSYPPPYDDQPWQVGYYSPPHPTLSRWAALNDALEVFVAALDDTDQSEYVSLVSFANQYSNSYYGVNQPTVQTDHNMTINYGDFLDALYEIGEEPICGGTNIGAGIDRARNILTDTSQTRPFAFRTLVVMTDGNWNAGRSPVTAAHDAVAQNIQIHTITFSEEADQNLMREVAEVGHGIHQHASNAAQLEAAFRKIAYTLPVVITE